MDIKEEDNERIRRPAPRARGWIDNDARVNIPNLFIRGGRWGPHRPYPNEGTGGVRDPESLAFGTERPAQQSAGTVVVGGASSLYCGTCVGLSGASRACSPNVTSGEARDRDFGDRFQIDPGKPLRHSRERWSRMVDEQLRAESMEVGTKAAMFQPQPRWQGILFSTRIITKGGGIER